jgi:hypothetical protein
MVVVAIIALLIGLLVPAISAVRKQAKVADTKALFATLTQGNEQFRTNEAIGGSYIPSATDSLASPDSQYSSMYNVMAGPFQSVGGEQYLLANGANLLVYGLAGADGLGTAGFLDLDRDGAWCNDIHDVESSGDEPDGAYALDPDTRDPLQPRHGPYISDDAFSRIKTMEQVAEDGVVVDGCLNDACRSQKVFVDAWGQPVLYYRARKAARFMVTNPGGDEIGVFDQRDNAFYTGSHDVGAGDINGLDMGAGKGHKIDTSEFPEPNPNNSDLAGSDFDNTFERFIWDQSVPQKNVPVNRETFLLISAGADALYGTTDDVVNWTRE